MGYIYLIKPVEFNIKNKDVYKIGRTTKANPKRRLHGYDRNFKPLLEIFVEDSIKKEKEILEIFKKNFIQYQEDGYENSREFFQGNKE